MWFLGGFTVEMVETYEGKGWRGQVCLGWMDEDVMEMGKGREGKGGAPLTRSRIHATRG